MLYWDKKEAMPFLQQQGLQLPGLLIPHDGFIKILHPFMIRKEAPGLSQEHLSTTGPNQKRKNLFLSSILNSISVVKHKSERNRTYMEAD